MCGAPGDVVPQLQLDEAVHDRPLLPPLTELPPLPEADETEDPDFERPLVLNRDIRKRGRRWGRSSAAGSCCWCSAPGHSSRFAARAKRSAIGTSDGRRSISPRGSTIAPSSNATKRSGSIPAAPAYVQRAAALINKGEHEQAIADCTRAIELDPELALAYANRGGARVNRGEFEPAIADCSRALQLDPQLAVAFANRGGAYIGKGDIERCIADCSQALALNPDEFHAYVNRGVALLNKGENKQAIKDFDEAIHRQPKLAHAYANRGIAYLNEGDLERARSDMDRAIELAPKWAGAYVDRAMLHLMRNASDRAIADCNRAIALEPRLAKAYHTPRSGLHAQRGRGTSAGRSAEGHRTRTFAVETVGVQAAGHGLL